jgi:hypothetical protein
MLFDLIKNIAAGNEGSDGFIAVHEDVLKAMVLVKKKKELKVDIKAKDLGGALYQINVKALCEIAKAVNDDDRNLFESISLVSLNDLIKSKEQ